jgi:hypothetical protein
MFEFKAVDDVEGLDCQGKVGKGMSEIRRETFQHEFFGAA